MEQILKNDNKNGQENEDVEKNSSFLPLPT